jgi:outer membrane protein OmpA-like peptidoglycan-associated protein
VEGHTDNVGNAETNQTLSEQRAKAVAAALAARGVPADRLLARGFGANRPVGDNTTEAGRAANRRIAYKAL